MSSRKEIHDRVLNATGKQELMDAYKEWADKYDADLIDEMGYVAPVIAGKLLLRYIKNPGIKILDAGCGTGLVGAFLSENGCTDITGLDYSQDMLEQAKGKDVYQSLVQGDLTQTLDIERNAYDAVISVGTFTSGHVGPQALGELVRITKPGGLICFTVREAAWIEDDYRNEIARMKKGKAWTALEEKTSDYIQKEGSTCKVCLYQVAG
ncbi:Methyltransferase domain-containing protein [Desulfatibacillum alkenivorans DSM 16219]|jgi:predicted TPR repeat methyltransferase|uniref:Methyltransferase domain-containing protein n=1 Tax=Desulfatibacillum alkenivorans DSM 16219 TaxID=1121393 RepID=A0A1M6J403_9BACT|nr:class I SAM-dependent methyltransferase [Desulfatibacillum alkenivorans]SHJ41409.1 Methyltransferase domain-containing protein [Desulfatibacillum alkenivorans DSM 16219]